jgi:hypothetical protein
LVVEQDPPRLDLHFPPPQELDSQASLASHFAPIGRSPQRPSPSGSNVRPTHSARPTFPSS